MPIILHIYILCDRISYDITYSHSAHYILQNIENNCFRVRWCWGPGIWGSLTKFILCTKRSKFCTRIHYKTRHAGPAAIDAVKAGAPIEKGNRASKADAIIFLLGRKAAAKAGKTEWQAIVDGTAEWSKFGGTQAQKNAAIKAVKAGAPTENKGVASKNSALMWAFSGENKSAHSAWAQRATAGTAIRKKGTYTSSVAKKNKTFSQPIATHSHECKNPSCRQLVKITSKMDKGREFPNLTHGCLVTNGNVGGLVNHLCSTCHQTGRVCKNKVCRGLKCTRSRPDCTHLHDGSGTPRK